MIFFSIMYFCYVFPPWPRSQLKGKGIAICDTLSFQSTSFSFIWYSLDIWFSSYLSFLSIIFHMQWQRERQIWQKRVIFCFSNTSSFSRPTLYPGYFVLINCTQHDKLECCEVLLNFLYDSNFIGVALCEENGQLINYSQEPKWILISVHRKIFERWNKQNFSVPMVCFSITCQ